LKQCGGAERSRQRNGPFIHSDSSPRSGPISKLRTEMP
jgi:hypothetical protein